MSPDASVSPHPAPRIQNREMQLLTFRLDEQEYGLTIDHVVQVIRMVALTRPPKAPDYVEGVFNLRGKVVPVIDLRKRCGLPVKPIDVNTQLLVAQTNGHTVALTVDAVEQVVTMLAQNLESPEEIGSSMEHLMAIGKVGDRLLFVIDPATIVPAKPTELNALEKAA